MPSAAAGNLNEALAERLEPTEMMKVAILARFGTIAAWARIHGWYPVHVHETLARRRRGEDVRAAFATDFEVDRELVDEALLSTTKGVALEA